MDFNFIMTSPVKHAVIEQLIDAHLKFLSGTLCDPQMPQEEIHALHTWFGQKTLKQIWSFEQIHTAITHFFESNHSLLLPQLAQQLNFALTHQINEQTKIDDVFDVMHIDRLAQYISSKQEHREKLVQYVVYHESFSTMVSQLVHHTLEDYFQERMSQKAPNVGRFMKMGKSVFETVTDSKLEETIQQYLNKNLLKLSELSEKLFNQYFTNDKLYHLQAGLWHKYKDAPLSLLKDYIVIDDVSNNVSLSHDFWAHFKQTPYFKTQIHDGLKYWYEQHQNHMLSEFITEDFLITQVKTLVLPFIEALSTSGYLETRARLHLEKFYYDEETLKILSLK